MNNGKSIVDKKFNIIELENGHITIEKSHIYEINGG